MPQIELCEGGGNRWNAGDLAPLYISGWMGDGGYFKAYRSNADENSKISPPPRLEQ